jgi:formamidopyrimidine-DNA glycosylase
MPELPEVETTARGIRPHVTGKIITDVIVRDARLRWPVPSELPRLLRGNVVQSVERRAKYLLLHTRTGTLLIHLGMSGSLRILPAATPAQKHDHVDLVFDDHTCLRLRDPRRFGCLLWCDGDAREHSLLRELGPEPLDNDFDGACLFEQSRGRKAGVKLFIMDAHIVVGVGNIYANEALFLAGIDPRRAAGKITRPRYDRLADCIKRVLRDAIEQGGTTLRDYVRSSGDLGYFQLKLNVYGKEGEPCPKCGTAIKHLRLGQRSTYFCPRCQR